MSQSPKNESCCGPEACPAPASTPASTPAPGASPVPLCPKCGRKGRPVPLLALKHHLPPPANFDIAQDGFFCKTPDCPVVYFFNNGVVPVLKDGVRYPIGIKSTADPHTLCYCFGITREFIEDEVRRTGDSRINQKISREVKAGNCACETKNPQGGCCLGDVVGAIQSARKARVPAASERIP